MSTRPIINLAARSPYQRYGKTPYKYPAWVTERRNAPADIAGELRIARYFAANAAEERRVKKKRSRPGHGRTPDCTGTSITFPRDPGALGLSRSARGHLLD